MQGLHRVISTFKVSAQMPSVASPLQAMHRAGDFNSFIFLAFHMRKSYA